ncbi:hypothetical protein VTK73DRAFT_9560 [Phialemonium thermophilum]|uniref:SUI1 domain-containing protein n=1 Tax=Phialemonium thermophilum TaxID=223376 RepID=A0ABR3W2F4_9PEZI
MPLSATKRTLFQVKPLNNHPPLISFQLAPSSVELLYSQIHFRIPHFQRDYFDKFMSIENLKTYDPFAEADEDTGQTNKTQDSIHIRIQQRNGRKTLTTVQGIPPKFDHKKILKVIKKEFACNGTIISDTESKGMGEVIQLQGDQRNKIKEFLTDKENGLGLEESLIKVHGF